MSSRSITTKLETRNSKLARYGPNSELRVSSFAIPNFRFRFWGFIWPLTLVAALGSGLRPAYGEQRVWEKRFELPPGGHVSVVNVQGSVLVEGWDRAEVEATVAMRSEAPTDQLDDVQVAVEASHGSVALHTLYPSGLDTPIRVEYRLRVPRQVHLDELSTLDGDIVVHDVEGAMSAHNLHGDIEAINLAGSVTAHALTGNILISLSSLPDPRLPIQIATINGNVDVLLPPQANANLELSTVAGNIVGNYVFQVSSTPGDSTRRAQVGAGGVRVELRTVRGNIRVGEREEDL
jgi:hypothetical protein